MSPTLIMLTAAAGAVIAFTTSALVGLGLGLSRRWRAGLTPAGQARVLLGAALAPAIACAALLTAAMAPSLGWIVDHCVPVADAHAHPHLCARHHVAIVPGLVLLALAALLVGRVLLASAAALRGARRAHLVRRGLAATSTPQRLPGDAATPWASARVVPLPEPQAFVLGVVRPQLFVTAGLLAPAHQLDLAPALAHELAHLRRRDPLRRLVASVALAFHLPVLARGLGQRLASSHELAADAAAAASLADPGRVASALLRLVRAHRQLAAPVLAFADRDLERRVHALLDPRRRRDGGRLLVALLVLAPVLVALTGADAVHHGVEIVLGLLG